MSVRDEACTHRYARATNALAGWRAVGGVAAGGAWVRRLQQHSKVQGTAKLVMQSAHC